METLGSISTRCLFLSCHESITKLTLGNYASSMFIKPSIQRSKLILGKKRSIGEISLQAATARQIEITDKLETSTNVAENVKEEEHLRFEKLVNEIKDNLRSVKGWGISVSAYDTAWVAKIPSVDDPNKPQFQECVDWILKNQHEDGSWGQNVFLLYDRLASTLSCLLSLKTWNVGEAQMAKGLHFMTEYCKGLEDQNTRLLPCGFEFVFPSMLKEARDLGLDLPYDLPCLKKITTLRDAKMKRIPVEVMHSVYTTILYSLEAVQEVVDWDKIVKMQCQDGSFHSLASSAVAYMKTGDKKCLEFLTNTVRKFNGGVPNEAPIDNFERIWVADTIQRLGIDHLFQKEISDMLYYVYRHIGERGIAWGKYCHIPDADDTCMGLRLLRLQGYAVTPDIMEHFRGDDGNMVCYPGETDRGVSDVLNLYRFSQIKFPGENILKEANDFTKNYLKTCLEKNDLADKWSMKKALREEVTHALRYPWKTSLQRLDVREYLDQYGENDVWIAKTLYRLFNVNNPKYLELAKLEFNRLQNIHKEEIISLLEWWKGCGLGDHFSIEAGPEKIHFLVSATLYDPKFSAARIAYTKCNCLENILKDHFENHESAHDLRIICQAAQEWNPSLVDSLPPAIKLAFQVMYATFNDLVKEASNAQGKDMFSYIHNLRWKQLLAYLKNREMREEKHSELSRQYIEVGKRDAGVAIRVLPSMFLLGERLQGYDLRCLDDRSRFHNMMSLYLTLIEAKSNESIPNEEVARVVTCVAKEDDFLGDGAESHLCKVLDDCFDELVHEYLKPGRVPRNSRRLMFEHGKIMQHLLHAKIDPEKRKEMINTMAYLSTPV